MRGRRFGRLAAASIGNADLPLGARLALKDAVCNTVLQFREPFARLTQESSTWGVEHAMLGNIMESATEQ